MFRGAFRLGNAGVHQSRIRQIVHRHFDAAVHLRFGVHGRHHVHARCGGLHLRRIRVDVRFALRMLEDLRHVDQIDDLLAESRSRHLLQFQRVAHRWHIGDQFTRGLHMELLLGGARTRATGQPCQFLTRQIAALRLAHVGLAVAFHTLQHIRGITAFERVDRTVVHFPHRLAHLVEEPTVVGDEQQCALPRRPAVLQVLGEPVDRHHVQVVRRLVEREDVPILEQQTRQIRAAALAARQRADLRI